MKLTEIRKYLQSNLSFKRYSHSIRVEETSIKIAEIFGIDQLTCKMAGLSHDICRDMPTSEILNLLKYNLSSEEEFKLNNPILLHG